MLVAILCLACAALTCCVWYLSRQLWQARWHVRNRDWERQTVFGFLNEIGAHFTSRLNQEDTLELVVDFSLKATKADAGGIFTISGKQRDVLVPRVIKGLFPPLHEVSTDKLASKRKYLEDFVKKEKLNIGEGIIGLVARTGEALLIPDAKADPRVPKSASDLVELDGLILAPLKIQGEVQGVIVVMNKRDRNAPTATFDEADLNLMRALGDQAAITLHMVRLYEEVTQKQRIEQELRIAQEFQRQLLPQEMPKVAELDIAGASASALEVGGDYFDFIDIDQDHLGVVVADVSGKGIPGALVMALLRSALRAEARGDLSPREVLRRVNAIVTRDTKPGTFVSATYGIIDRRTGRFRYSRAGHEPLLCMGANGAKPTSHEPAGMVLGMVEGELFDLLEEGEVDLRTCGTVVLYTDGVPEAMNGAREEYGVERFEGILSGKKETPPDGIVRAVLDDISRFSEGLPQHDDITLVVLRWKGQSAA